MIERFPITKRGYEKLDLEIKHLKYIERPAIVQAIATAREHGDLSENAEYHAAKEKQAFIEGKIMDLEGKCSRVDIFNPTKLSSQSVMFGATVTLVDVSTDEEVLYHIVGDYEADISKKLVSISAPIAKGMIGKSAGDEVVIETLKHKKIYEIVKVEYIDFEI